METGILISIGALVVAALGLILNSRKETRSDAAALARIDASLQTVNSGVNDIRVELRTMQGDINNHSERLARVEARTENNTQRLNVLEGKTK